MMIGTLPPTGPIEKSCTSVTMPATSIAFCSSDTWIAANCSASLIAAHALVMIRMGVRLPTNIASTCCSPSGIACPSGILAVKLYGPKKDCSFFSFSILSSLF